MNEKKEDFELSEESKKEKQRDCDKEFEEVWARE